MNKTRRQMVTAQRNKLEEVATDLENLRDEEEEYKENMPENLVTTERYSRAAEAIDSLQEAKDSVDAALQHLEDALA